MSEEIIDEQFLAGNKVPLKIYSKKAIWGFSVFFTPVFGGVLLRQNLIDQDNKKAGNFILLVSILFTGITLAGSTIIGKNSSSVTLPLNMLGGLALSEHFYKKYFPDNNYEYKKIWKALIISFLIMVPFILALIYGTP